MAELEGAPARDAGGRWVAGMSGNPAGKRPGTRNRATVLREALRDGEDLAAARAIIDKAVGGNAVAARWLLDAIAPKPRGRPIDLALAAGADLEDACDATVRAMVSGEVSPDEALMITRLLHERRGRAGALAASAAAAADPVAPPAEPAAPPPARSAAPPRRPADPAFALHLQASAPPARAGLLGATALTPLGRLPPLPRAGAGLALRASAAARPRAP